jgi:hypothetical protein
VGSSDGIQSPSRCWLHGSGSLLYVGVYGGGTLLNGGVLGWVGVLRRLVPSGSRYSHLLGFIGLLRVLSVRVRVVWVTGGFMVVVGIVISGLHDLNGVLLFEWLDECHGEWLAEPGSGISFVSGLLSFPGSI